VVVAIILVLYVMLLGPSSKSSQIRRIASCGNNLKNIHVALTTYSLTSKGGLPLVAGAKTSEAPLSELIPRYTTGSQYFICPGGQDSALPDAQPFADRKISYAYYMGRSLKDGAGEPVLSDRQVNTTPKLPGQPLFSADGARPGNNHNKFGGNILFCDGAVQWSPASSAFTLTNPPDVLLLNPKP